MAINKDAGDARMGYALDIFETTPISPYPDTISALLAWPGKILTGDDPAFPSIAFFCSVDLYDSYDLEESGVGEIIDPGPWVMAPGLYVNKAIYSPNDITLYEAQITKIENDADSLSHTLNWTYSL